MKKPRKAFAANLATLLFVALLSACAKGKVDNTIPANTSASASLSADQSPDADDPAQLTDDGSAAEELDGFTISMQAASSVHISAELNDAASPQHIHGADILYNQSAREFAYNGEDELVWTIRLQNLGGLSTPESHETGFIVLCDGVPTEFTHMPTNETLTHFSHLLKSNTFKISFHPEFASGIGRIDFLSFCNEEMFSFAQINGQTVLSKHLPLSGSPDRFLAALPGDYYPMGSSILSTAAYTVPVREALIPYTNGTVKTIVSQLPGSLGEPSTIAAQLMGENDYDEASTLTELKTFDLRGDKNFVFEFAANTPGQYRIVAMLDYEPFPLFDGESIIDCRLTEDDMLSFSRPIGNLIPEGSHAFFILATRLDGDWLTNQPMESIRYELIR